VGFLSIPYSGLDSFSQSDRQTGAHQIEAHPQREEPLLAPGACTCQAASALPPAPAMPALRPHLDLQDAGQPPEVSQRQVPVALVDHWPAAHARVQAVWAHVDAEEAAGREVSPLHHHPLVEDADQSPWISNRPLARVGSGGSQRRDST